MTDPLSRYPAARFPNLPAASAALQQGGAVILACPACTTRFRVGAAALAGASGRRLRCAQCGTVWQYRREAPPPVAEASLSPTAPLSAADRLDVPAFSREPPRLRSAGEQLAIEALGLDGADHDAAGFDAAGFDAAGFDDPAGATRLRRVPRLDAPPPILRADAPTVQPLGALPSRDDAMAAIPTAAARRVGPLAAGLGLAGLAAAIALVAFLARDRLATIWPAAAPAPVVADLAPPAGAGLKVTLSPQRTGDALVINGAIVNRAAVVRRIPPLRVTLRDRHEAALTSQVIDPPVVRLAPGASAHFNAVFEHPSGAATGVAVTFATD
ncbi:MAG TPA: DUF3426 domain-containing protein [Stellaceae bacterium]|nr:DUF3426 domain-containing protein [Stellaceae bacterium]